MQKLIKDIWRKTAFFNNNKLYRQIDSVSIGSSLVPLLANNIITEMEKTIIKKFIGDSVSLFYGRYVDDILVVIKREKLKFVHDVLNKIDKSLNFSTDILDNVVPHFLRIEIHPDGLRIYCKDTSR